ncbi:MAG: formate/nitrite transporter family protein [Gammaproteobacteria bacterium]|nr:formate/nitrite transporter family protein [Gammaproteobacteria bacterium]
MTNTNRVTLLSPKEIADKVEFIGITKVQMPIMQILLLGVLAGAYIGFGAMFYTIVKSDSSLGFAVSQTVAGLVFSLGLILVCISGAELFTGNNLLLLAWSKKKITAMCVAKNWVLVIFSNLVGAVLLAIIIYYSGHTEMNHGKIAETYVKIANAKASLGFVEAFLKGILCNVLVCLAVWMAYAGQTVTDKVMGIIFPVAAFVAAGFEHSVANMYVFSVGLLESERLASATDALTFSAVAGNIIPVLLGNIIGGGVFVGLVYSTIFKSEALTENQNNK